MTVGVDTRKCAIGVLLNDLGVPRGIEFIDEVAGNRRDAIARNGLLYLVTVSIVDDLDLRSIVTNASDEPVFRIVAVGPPDRLRAGAATAVRGDRRNLRSACRRLRNGAYAGVAVGIVRVSLYSIIGIVGEDLPG